MCSQRVNDICNVGYEVDLEIRVYPVVAGQNSSDTTLWRKRVLVAFVFPLMPGAHNCLHLEQVLNPKFKLLDFKLNFRHITWYHRRSCLQYTLIEQETQMGGCQNYGPFLVPYYNTAPNILGTQKGTIILTTTQIFMRGDPRAGATTPERCRFRRDLGA